MKKKIKYKKKILFELILSVNAKTAPKRFATTTTAQTSLVLSIQIFK